MCIGCLEYARRCPRCWDRVVGTDGVHASTAFRLLSQAWLNGRVGYRARDTGHMHCRSSGNLCGVKNNPCGGSRDSSRLRGWGDTESPPVPLSSPHPEGCSCFPIDVRKLRFREVKCMAQGHPAGPRGPSQILAPCSSHDLCCPQTHLLGLFRCLQLPPSWADCIRVIATSQRHECP